MVKGLECTFLKRRQQIYENVLNITNHQGNENHNRYHLIPVRTAIKKSKISIGEDVQKKEIIVQCW